MTKYKESSINLTITAQSTFTDLTQHMYDALQDLNVDKGTKVTISINNVEMAQVLYNTLGEYRLISSRYRYSTVPIVYNTLSILAYYFSRLVLDMACMSGVEHRDIMPNMIAYMETQPTSAIAIATHTPRRFNAMCAMEYLLAVLEYLHETHANSDQLH